MFTIFLLLLLPCLGPKTFLIVDQSSLGNDYSIIGDPFEIHREQMTKIFLIIERAFIREQNKDTFEISPCNLLLSLYGSFDSQ